MTSPTTATTDVPLLAISRSISRLSRSDESQELQAALDGFRLEIDDATTSLFEAGIIPADHRLSWESIMADPKIERMAVKRTYKNFRWRIQHTGGFCRLFTARGLVYWLKQCTCSHMTPDWKIHFSVDLEQIGAAWNIIAGLFMETDGEFGMKATYTDPDKWSKKQRGREVTVYIFVHDRAYEDHPVSDDGHGNRMPPMFQSTLEAEDGGSTQDHPQTRLGVEFERFAAGDTYWSDFILEAERRLAAANIRSRGVADGDYPLPGCTYASIRNESYVKDLGTIQAITYDPETHAPVGSEERDAWLNDYPANYAGWNAAAQSDKEIRSIILQLKGWEREGGV